MTDWRFAQDIKPPGEACKNGPRDVMRNVLIWKFGQEGGQRWEIQAAGATHEGEMLDCTLDRCYITSLNFVGGVADKE